MDIPGWEKQGEVLFRSFKFAGFTQAMDFMNECVGTIEKLNHHPEWTNVYNRVDVRLTTHDAGGVTDLDIALAQEMNKVFESMANG